MTEPLGKNSPQSGGARATAVALGVACVAGLALRLWGIQNESAWWDEYSSLMHLGQPTLQDFLAHNRIYDPATLPLYYAIEYIWSRIAGTGTLAMRLPSLLLGVLLVPLVYALGARIAGRNAGLFAAACVALSPIHAFHAQGVRMYVLFTLLAVCSMYTFLRLREGDKRWWAAHTVAQLLLSWTHPFALLLLPVQGLAWLTSGFRHEWRRALAWGMLCIVACAPALGYLSTIEYWSEDSTAHWFAAPTLPGALADIFADDVISATYQLRESPGAYWGLVPVLAARPVLDGLLVATLFLLATYAMVQSLRAGSTQSRNSVVLLALWCVLPVLMLYAASLAVRPMLFPRYTVHASLALYLLAGVGLAALPGVALRRVAAALALGLLAYQVGLAHPGPQRTDYKGVAAALQAQAEPARDMVLVQGDLWRDLFAYNAAGIGLPIVSTGDDPRLTALCARHFIGGGGRTLWLLAVGNHFDAQTDPKLESALTDAGLTFEREPFFGIEQLFLYRLTGKGLVDAPGGWTELALGDEDSPERRALRSGIVGVAAALAAQGSADSAAALVQAYLGESAQQDYAYGVIAKMISEEPGEALAAYATVLDLMRALGIQEQGHPGLAAEAVLAVAANGHAPALAADALVDFALDFPQRAQVYLAAANAAAHPPEALFFHLLDAIIAAGDQDATLTAALIDALLAVKNIPEYRYENMLDRACAVARKHGCVAPVLPLLEAARPLSPLHFELNCSAIVRACVRGAAIVPYIDAKVQMDKGMVYFGQQNYPAASEAFKAASVEQFGFPVMMLGVLDLLQGNKQSFREGARKAIDMDPGLKAVVGAWLEALLIADRPGAEAAALGFRGTDLDISEVLLGLTATYFDGAPSPA